MNVCKLYRTMCVPTVSTGVYLLFIHCGDIHQFTDAGVSYFVGSVSQEARFN